MFLHVLTASNRGEFEAAEAARPDVYSAVGMMCRKSDCIATSMTKRRVNGDVVKSSEDTN